MRGIGLLIAAMFSCLLNAQAQDANRLSLSPTCQFSTSATDAGHDTLALVIGINDYEDPRIPDLGGAAGDAERFLTLLTDASGPFHVPKANTCLLTDSDATVENVLTAFSRFLIDRVDGEDQVIIYFAGHGSQIADADDEEDGMDETLALHDSMTLIGSPGMTSAQFQTPHLTDDVFGALLDSVNARLQRDPSSPRHALTVILDSCNSRSAVRSAGTSRFAPEIITERYSQNQKARYAPIWSYLVKAGLNGLAIKTSLPGTLRDENLMPAGAVILTAAGDGEPANEFGGKGVFTTALIDTLARSDVPLNYRQLSWRIRDEMRGAGQVSYAVGMLDALVFSEEVAGNGASHRVARVEGDSVELTGVPLPGLGKGAEFRIFKEADAEAIATVVVDQEDNIAPRGNVASLMEGASIEVGDAAALVSPSPKSRKLVVGLGSDLSEEWLAGLAAAISKDADTRNGIIIVPNGQRASEPVSFWIVAQGKGIGVVDAGGRSRTLNAFKPTEKGFNQTAEMLSGFARQKSLRALKGEGKGLLFDDRSVSLSLRPWTAARPNRCRSNIRPPKSPRSIAPNRFETPECSRFSFVVEGHGIDRELQVAIVFLANDGGIYVLPRSENQIATISPKAPIYAFDAPEEVFQSLPPLDAEEDILIFAVDARSPIPWQVLTKPRAQRTASAYDSSGLTAELMRYMDYETRRGEKRTTVAPVMWTLTQAGLRPVRAK